MLLIAFRMARAELRQHPLQVVLAFLMVATAAALAVLALGLQRTTGAAYERVLNEAHGGHVWLFSTNAGDLPERALRVGGVESVTPALRRARVSLTGRDTPYQVMLWAVPAEPLLPAPTLLREGRLPAAGAAEIVIDRSFARRAKLAIGDTVTIASDGGKVAVTVVGIGVNNSQAPYPLDRPPDAFSSLATIDRVAGGRYESSAVGVRLLDPNSADQFVSKLSAAGGGQVFGYRWTAIRDTLEQSNLPASILIRTFAVFAFLSVGLVLANTVSAQLLGKVREIGLLRAAGLSPRQLTFIVVAQYASLALVAALAGVAAGALLMPLALSRIASVLDTTPPTPFEPLQFGIVVLATVVLTGICVLLPARAAGRGTVAASLHGMGLRNASRPPFLLRLTSRLDLRPSIRLGLKDAFSRPARAWLTIAAIALAAATVAMSLTIEATGRAIDSDPRIIGQPPFHLRLTARRQPTADQLTSAIATIQATPGVAATILERSGNATIDGKDFFAGVAITGDLSAMPFTISSGRLPQKEGEAVVGTAIATANSITLGQSIELTPRGGRAIPLEVVGIIPDDERDGRVVMFLGSGRGNPAVDVRVAKGTKPAAIARQVEAAYPGLFDINDLDARFHEDLGDQRTELRTIMFSLDTALVLVALANLLGVLLLTIRERTRELGILRVLGVTPAQLMTAIGVSSALYAGLGILIGGPLGYYITVRLFDYFGANTGWPEGITQAPPTEWAAMALLGGIILLALFVLIPARTATRLNVSEALREE